MIEFNYKERLEVHISALINAYEKQLLLLNRDLSKKESKDDESDKEELKITDSQVKSFSDGIAKSAETADELLASIKAKISELDELNKKEAELNDGDKKKDSKAEKEEIKEPSEVNQMNEHVS